MEKPDKHTDKQGAGSVKKPKIALFFRYGPAEHAELFHAMPLIVQELARDCEVHYYGMRDRKPVPEAITRNAVIHSLPFGVDRTSELDKHVKTFLWLLALPWISLACRFSGVKAVYIDETVPLTALIAKLFFGPKTAFTVADIFVDVYKEKSFLLRIFGGLIKKLDFSAWRRLPLIFTRARATKTYLVARGVPEKNVYPVYDPCDFTLYHPDDKTKAKKRFGFDENHIVLVHHGILHPNKGNSRVIEVLAGMISDYPDLRYLLVGDGPEMTDIKKLVSDSALERCVKLTGWLPTPEDVNVALNSGDIGLVMRVGNQSDDFHMTGALVHNMACGLPILAARLGGVSEVVEEGKNGMLFDPSNMAEFREKLEFMITHPEHRTTWGATAAEDARRYFDMAAVAQNTVRPLLNLAGIGE